jgi:hypothetical protein
MNFEKTLFKYKNNIIMFLVIFFAIAFITTPNKIDFMYSTPLGRGYLIALLIIITTYSPYLGLFTVVIISMIYNTTDTITENFVEGADSTSSDDKTKTESPSLLSSALGSIGLKPVDSEEDKKKAEEDKKKEDDKSKTQTSIVEKMDSMIPKDSNSLINTSNFFGKKIEPMANWGGSSAYNLGYAPVNY